MDANTFTMITTENNKLSNKVFSLQRKISVLYKIIIATAFLSSLNTVMIYLLILAANK